MWFAKLFGGRNEEHEDDEPARFPPAAASSASPTRPESRARTTPLQNSPKKGFDPYNSGAFERKNAWERTNRR